MQSVGLKLIVRAKLGSIIEIWIITGQSNSGVNDGLPNDQETTPRIPPKSTHRAQMRLVAVRLRDLVTYIADSGETQIITAQDWPNAANHSH